MARRSVFVAMCACVALACSKGGAPRAPAIGAAAPEYGARTLDDTPATLSSLRGRVVVLNVWATWCQPCREELPQLQALHQEFASQEVSMIGVSVDAAGTALDVRDFVKEHGMTYPIWLDPEHDFALKFLTVGVPETFLVDRAGVIRWRKIGALARGDTTLASAIRRALKS